MFKVEHLTCLVCGCCLLTKIGFIRHIKKCHNITLKEYYDTFILKSNENACSMSNCDNFTEFDPKKFEYKKVCKICNNMRVSTLEFYEIRYGKEEGNRLYSERKKNISKSTKGRSGHSLDDYIKKYGEEEGTKKFNQFSKKLSENRKGIGTLEYYIKKFGKEEGNKLYIEVCKKSSTSKESFIVRYGEEEGTNLYNKRCECISKNTKGNRTFEYYINKYGEEKGTKIYNKNCKSYGNTQENFIKRYGEPIGKEKYKKYCDGCSHNLNFFIDKYGEKEGKEKYFLWIEKSQVNFNDASKESMNIFFPLMDWLLEEEICTLDDIYVGIKGSTEWFIRDQEIYFYDFTIPKFKIIIEYNGETFHPNPKWLNEDKEKWDMWESPFSKEDSKTVYDKDMKKTNHALNKEFYLIKIWSSDDESYNLNYCKRQIIDHFLREQR